MHVQGKPILSIANEPSVGPKKPLRMSKVSREQKTVNNAPKREARLKQTRHDTVCSEVVAVAMLPSNTERQLEGWNEQAADCDTNCRQAEANDPVLPE